MAAKRFDFSKLGRAVVSFTKQMLVYVAVSMVALAVIDLIFGWRTVYLYAESLFLGGGIIAGIGALSTFGRWGGTRNFQQQYAASAGDANLRERTEQQGEDDEKSYSFSSLAIGCGLVLSALSILIHQLI